MWQGALSIVRKGDRRMCDETTEAENELHLAKTRLNRRAVGMGAGAAVATLLAGCSTSPAPNAVSTDGTARPDDAPKDEAKAATESRMVTIDTPDGSAEAFFVMPKSGAHPGVIMWPDVAGLRDAYKTMATRLAAEGYAVLAVNPYYRSSKLPVLTTFADWQTDEGKAKIAPMREALTPEAIAKDGAAFVRWLDAQKEVDTTKKLGAMGYCMSGSFTFRAAAAVPERVGAIASFHGGGLVSEEPTSPHTLFAAMKAAALICVAQNDDAREPEAKTTLKTAAEAANVAAEIEVYPASHGWCTIDSPVYDRVQAERAWARLLATLAERL
jgi:carboxymethylenebutenolidase